jgi:hypothetical protein
MTTKEPKRDRFVRLAEKRMRVLMKSIRTLGNPSNRSVYEFTDTDVETMTGALLKEVTDFTQRMKRTKGQIAFSFSLKDADPDQ